jgi:hypothetical protein
VRVTAGSIGLMCILSCLGGCGGGDGGGYAAPQQVVTHILSDPAYDGDIEQTSSTSFTITQGMSGSVQTVLAGIDPTAGTEFRAFLDFPLGGPDGVPGDAIIDSAYLEVLVDNLIPSNGSLPVRVELVEFQPPTLTPEQFDRSAQPALGAVLVSGDVTSADVGQYVSVDVTTLMAQAQQLGLTNFQVRVMEDLGPAIGVLMEMDDTIQSDRPQRAPVLTVTYH